MKTWLSVVAPHVNYQQCCETAKVGLASGNELASFPCPKWVAVCCNPIERANRLYAQHGCLVCGHKWSKYPLVLGNPLAVLKCQLRDSCLFVSTLPVDRSILGWLITIQDVFRMLILVLLLLGIMSNPLFHRWLRNHLS